MHWDAEDLLHGGEDLGHFFYAAVGSVLRDDNGLVDIFNDRKPKGYRCDTRTQASSLPD